ncbi:MAG: glycosyltransferase [Proteobacteria bacterium]|nr:glycosyltransferase [Pseudomonadota bacterium]
MKPRQTVAVVMPSLNEEASVDATLNAVFASTRLPDEIVVADAFSKDRTRERIAAFAERGVPIRLIDNPGIFAGAGRNAAAQATHCDILLFLDFGNIVDPGWIEAMTQPFESGTVDAVGGLFIPFCENDFERCIAAIQYQEAILFARLPRAEQIARLPDKIRLGGLGSAVSRDCYTRIGGMPAWLRAGEDQLFGHKLLAAGARIAPALDARLFHHMRDTPGALYRQNLVYARGDGYTNTGQAHYGRTFALYAAILASLLALPWLPAGGIMAAALFGAYGYATGFRRLRRVHGTAFALRQLASIPLILLPKDIGTIAGYIQGRWGWLTRPQLRTDYHAYMQRPT